MNLRRYWENRVQKHPSKTFLYASDESVSYGEFEDRVNRAANGLLDLGLKPGGRVCLMLPNVPEFLYCWIALCKVGAVPVPINTNFKANEAKYVLNHSEAVGLIVSEEHLEIVTGIQTECHRLRWVACAGAEPNRLPAGVIDFGRLSGSMPKTLRPSEPAADDLACVIYTSGTTGFPKGVMHGHRSVWVTGEAFLVRAEIQPDDRILTILPLFHMNAMFYSVWGAIAGRASLILIREFSAGRFWDQAVRYGATEFNFVGTMGSVLCSRSDDEFLSGHGIRVAVGAGISPRVYETFTQKFKIPHVIDAYGMTEIPAVSQNPIGGVVKMKSIGLPATHPDWSTGFSQMRVVDEHGREAPVGTMGELTARNPVMMHGYFNDPQKTAEAVRDGWFYTGDYAYKDEDGYFYFVDRKKDVIRKKGENISATEVEGVINENPRVLESAVIAVPSELGEDEVMACVVLVPGQAMTGEELIEWCRDRLADFKLPRFVQFRASLPKTSTQRVAKPVLKEDPGLLSQAVDLEAYKISRRL